MCKASFHILCLYLMIAGSNSLIAAVLVQTQAKDRQGHHAVMQAVQQPSKATPEITPAKMVDTATKTSTKPKQCLLPAATSSTTRCVTWYNPECSCIISWADRYGKLTLAEQQILTKLGVPVKHLRHTPLYCKMRIAPHLTHSSHKGIAHQQAEKEQYGVVDSKNATLIPQFAEQVKGKEQITLLFDALNKHLAQSDSKCIGLNLTSYAHIAHGELVPSQKFYAWTNKGSVYEGEASQYSILTSFKEVYTTDETIVDFMAPAEGSYIYILTAHQLKRIAKSKTTESEIFPLTLEARASTFTVSPCERFALLGDKEGSLTLIDLSTGKSYQLETLPKCTINALHWTEGSANDTHQIGVCCDQDTLSCYTLQLDEDHFGRARCTRESKQHTPKESCNATLKASSTKLADEHNARGDYIRQESILSLTGDDQASFQLSTDEHAPHGQALTWLDENICYTWSHNTALKRNGTRQTSMSPAVQPHYSRLRRVASNMASANTSVSLKTGDSSLFEYGFVDSSHTQTLPYLTPFTVGTSTLMKDLFNTIERTLVESDNSCHALAVSYHNEHNQLVQRYYYGTQNGSLYTGTSKSYGPPTNERCITSDLQGPIKELFVSAHQGTVYALTKAGLWKVTHSAQDVETQHVFAADAHSIETFTLSPDERYALFGYTDGTIMLYDMNTNNTYPIEHIKDATIDAIHWNWSLHDHDNLVCIGYNRKYLHSFTLILDKEHFGDTSTANLPKQDLPHINTELLKQQAVCDAAEQYAWTEFQQAAAQGDVHILQNIARDRLYNELSKQDSQGRTALLLAMQYGQIQFIRELSSVLKDTFTNFAYQQDVNGNTVFHYVLQYGHPALYVEMLLDYVGSDYLKILQMRNNRGISAVQAATRMRHRKAT